MHGSEREVHSDHHQPKVPFTNGVVELTAEHLGPPVIEAREQSEYCSTEQHVMEVRHDVVRVGLLRICRGYCVGNARETADSELNNQSNCEHHRNGEGELPAPHRHHPVHNLHTGRYCNSHCRHREHRNRDRAKTRGEHVVGPHTPANETNCSTRHRDDRVTEQRLLREDRDDFTDDAERRQNHDVHLRVTKNPEQVLPQKWVSARCNIKECCTE